MSRFSKEAFFLQTLLKYGKTVTRGLGDDCCVFVSKNTYPNNHRANINPYPFGLNTMKLAHQTHSNLCVNEYLQHKILSLNQTRTKSLVIGMDSFCEDIHFRANWLSIYEIAQKAFMVNYSDFVAMNAIPHYALLSIVLPKLWEKREIVDFVQGIVDFAKMYKIDIIGGDTTVGKSLQIHIVMLGNTNRHCIYRDKIPSNSLLVYTQGHYPAESIIQTSKMLKSLLYHTPHCLDDKPKKHNIHSRNRFKHIILRNAFVKECAHFVCGGMDISDGIYNELMRISMLNHLKLIPYFSLQKAKMQSILQSGEIYEMLLALNAKYLRVLRIRAKKYRIKLHTLGKLVRGSRSYTNAIRFKAKKWH